ncbi:MAG: NAD(P)H-dependent oxidoreductase [Alphaproteobacteria bacterium]|nr:NAD(P)H-dependent oxidoreductase [Alphaproteobacteria bacterium]
MTRPIHILGLSGSLRRNSFNTALLRAAGGLLPDGASLELHSLGAIPIYDGDVDDRGMPEPVFAPKCRIAAADALLLAVPGCNHSNAEGRFDAELRLTDERTRAAVGRLLRALVSWAQCPKQGGRALQEVA